MLLLLLHVTRAKALECKDVGNGVPKSLLILPGWGLRAACLHMLVLIDQVLLLLSELEIWNRIFAFPLRVVELDALAFNALTIAAQLSQLFSIRRVLLVVTNTAISGSPAVMATHAHLFFPVLLCLIQVDIEIFIWCDSLLFRRLSALLPT